MLSNDEIKNTIQNAFRPLRCVAAIWNYERKIKFLASKGDDHILEVSSHPLESLRNKNELRRFLTRQRKIVQEKGHALDPWTFPDLVDN
jgi:hypothetical protein